MSRVLSVCALASAAFAGFASTVFAAQDTLSEGRAVYVRANCVGCHKWHGDGGGGYGGAALSLRKTQLGRDDIIKTVTCGRPGTGMPFFMRDVYDDDAATHPCYDFSRKDLTGDNHVAEAGTFLRPNEIEAVADYVLANIKGHGEPNLAECVAFFGDASRVCEIYKPPSSHPMPTPSTAN
jgi:Cytochrome C oxidase, cbb3-type, subunit III